jgi:hypothetical protein
MSREEWNEYRLERGDEIRARFDDRAIDTGAEFGRSAGAGIDPLSSFYDLGAVAHYHDQPPFETPARTWLSARSITGDATVDDLLRWADQHAIANLESLEITLTYRVNATRTDSFGSGDGCQEGAV